MGTEQMTKAQKQAVEIRERNILVAAAAGSGKTWVLVKRIIDRMCNERLPVTSFLLVTFTKAAAAEMRGRLSTAIREQLIKEEATGQHSDMLSFWREQETLVYQAPISTIDSFCSDIVKQYFMTIDVDPNYRIADEGELKILKNEVVDKLLEMQYEELSEDFVKLLECYAPGRTDGKITELILGLFEFQMSHPDPDAWIAQSEVALKDGSLWYGMLLFHVRQMIASAIREQQMVMEYIDEEMNGTVDKAKDKLKEVLCEDESLLSKLYHAIDAGGDLDNAHSDAGFVNGDSDSDSDGSGSDSNLGESTDDSDKNRRTMESLYSMLQQLKFPTLRFPKDVSDTDKEWIKERREHYKKLIVEQIKKNYFQIPVSVLEEDRGKVVPVMHKLLLLSQEFRKEYEKEKRRKNIADFSDVEHMALHILTTQGEDRTFHPSDIALQLREEYAEIMIDEYQDSNYLQEMILTSVATGNMFMVGDMKQSIYRFRMARPDLFVGKYQSFPVYEEGIGADSVKVELDQNFRSSPNVLENINYIFYRIMGKSIGEVEYNRAAALKPGANYPAPEREQFQSDTILFEECNYDNDTELLLYDTNQEKETDRVEAEAVMIAYRIRQMFSSGSHMMVKDFEDKETGRVFYRPAKYSDIVVLLRSPSSSAAVFSKVFQDYGIPAFVERTKGYFSALEVELMLNYLRALNNGRDDIVMAAVLHNYFGEISSKELAFVVCEIREFFDREECNTQGYETKGVPSGIFGETDTLYGKVRCWLSLYENGVLCYGWKETNQGGTDEQGIRKEAADIDIPSLAKRLTHFVTQYERFQQLSMERSVGELLQCIYEESGYWRYVSIQPAGEHRCANLDMLVQRANDYENTGFRGLFQFVRYIEQLHQYEVDFGEPNLLGEEDNVVRIMSIHKSKGLEFPIVFVSQMAKQFNEMDLRADILLHEDYGLGPNYIDTELRIRRKTVMRMALALDSRKAMLGEELRVLYVALTRAKDKCIMTGCVENMEETLKKLPLTDYAGIYMAHSYLQWILMALSSHEVLSLWLKQAGCYVGRERDRKPSCEAAFSFFCFRKESIKRMMELQSVERNLDYKELEQKAFMIPEEQAEVLHSHIVRQYPYLNATTQVGKYSVSQLKAAYMEDAQSVQPFSVQEPSFQREEPLMPEFMKEASEESAKLTGAVRGTYIHKFMELYDFGKGADEEEYSRVLKELVARGMKGLSEVFSFDMVKQFFACSLAQEMVDAQRQNRLFKEAQFVVGFPANEVLDEAHCIGMEEETILVQGIIDAYYEQDDGTLVIMDYKTDRITVLEELKERYRLQMKYYKKTLEQITGKNVCRVMLYSFYKQEELCMYDMYME